MRKKLSLIMLAVLVSGLVATQPIERGSAPTLPKVFVDPPETKDPSKNVGSTFTIDVNVSNVVELFSWQVNMTFNPAVVNTTTASIVEGPFLGQAGNTMLLKKMVNNTVGFLAASYMLWPYPDHGASGNGTLFSITFKVKAVEKATLLGFVTASTKLNTITAGNFVPILHTTEDGIFDNRIGNADPIAAFSVDSSVANVGDPVGFDASASYDPDAWLVSYHWDYGDGKTEIYMRERLRNVNLTSQATHIYSRAGAYTVTLTVTDDNDATATETMPVSIKGHDVAIKNIVSSHLAVMVGDPVTVKVTVANNGNFTETFNVKAYYNETEIGTQEVVDMPAKTETLLTFTWSTVGVDLGNYILKANTSLVGDYDVGNNQYIDGIVEVALANIVDCPVVIGEFPFHVIIRTNSTVSGFQFSHAEKKITFDVAGGTGTVGKCNITIPIDLLGGPYTVWYDGSPVIAEETTNGTHTFLCLIYDHADSNHTVEIIGQTVATPPVAIFTVSTTREIAHIQIAFDATDSYDPDGTIQSYQWDFKDGNVTTVDTPIITHAYASAGDYTVTLKVKDNKQLANSTQNTVTIIDYPQAAFTYSPTIPLIDQTVTFNASTSEPNGGSIITYQWDFDDGSTGNGAIVDHVFASIGTYEVVLNVTDSEGLWDTETQEVTVSIRNVGITSLTATPTTVKMGQEVSVSITVVNTGNFTESFDVTVYYDSTTIGMKSILNLSPSATNTTTMAWDTASVVPGTYTLKANASILAGENVITDNSFVGSIVTVEKLDTQLTLSASLTTLTLGENTTLSGTFTPARSSVHITIVYRLVGETTWNIAGGTPTDEKSKYSFDWTPSTAGNYEVKASWQGDATTSPSESNTEQISVKEQPAPINFLYIIIPIIIVVIVAVAVYFLKIKK